MLDVKKQYKEKIQERLHTEGLKEFIGEELYRSLRGAYDRVETEHEAKQLRQVVKYRTRKFTR